MKHILITTIAAVLVVGCGQPPPDISIHYAAEVGNIEAVKQHLAAGTEVNAKASGWTPLAVAAHRGHKEVAELLITKGADVNVKNQRGRTPLYDAAIWDRKDIAKLLFDAGADVNAKDNDGKTPLDAAKEENKNEIADLLRKHGGKTGEELKGK